MHDHNIVSMTLYDSTVVQCNTVTNKKKINIDKIKCDPLWEREDGGMKQNHEFPNYFLQM